MPLHGVVVGYARIGSVMPLAVVLGGVDRLDLAAGGAVAFRLLRLPEAAQPWPAVVTTLRVAGSNFVLLAGVDGGPMPEPLRPAIGPRMRLDGEVARRGDPLSLRVAPEDARTP